MTDLDPFAPPPGPVRQYVDRASQLATKYQMDPADDVEAGVAAFAADIHAQAAVLVPEKDRVPFLRAVKGQVGIMIPGLGTPERIASDPGLARKRDALERIVGAIRV